ncbi:hexitol phosphatase HxpB [Nostoc sp.]
MIEAVIFDMDGVLIDSEPFWQQAEIEVFATVGVQLTHELCYQTTGLRMETAVEHWFAKYPWTNKSKKEVELEVKYCVAELIAAHAEPLSGARELISDFAERGLKLGLCSSSPYFIIEAVLKKLGVRETFSVIVSTEDEPFGKPHPGAYLTTAEKLEVLPVQCLVLEDSLNGMISGKAARMKVIAVPDPRCYHSTVYDFCDAKIASLNDFDFKILDGF